MTDRQIQKFYICVIFYIILLCTYGDIWINVHVFTILYLIIYLNCAEDFQMDHTILDLECIQNNFRWPCELYNTEMTYDFVIFNHNWYSYVSNTNAHCKRVAYMKYNDEILSSMI